MKKVCIYHGLPRPIKPLLETLKERGIPYFLKTKFTLRALHEWTPRDPLQGGGRKDYIGPSENIRLFVYESDEKEARRLKDQLLEDVTD